MSLLHAIAHFPATGQKIEVIPQVWAEFYVKDLKMTRDGKFMLFSDGDNSYKVVDYRKKWLLYEIKNIFGATLLNDNKIIGIQENKIVEYNLEDNSKKAIEIPGLTFKEVRGFASTEASDVICIDTWDSLYLIDYAKKRLLKSLKSKLNYGEILFINSKANKILYKTGDNIYVWNLDSKKPPVNVANDWGGMIMNSSEFVVIQGATNITIVDKKEFKILEKDSLKSEKPAPIYYDKVDRKLHYIQAHIDYHCSHDVYSFQDKNKSIVAEFDKSEDLMWAKSKQLNDTLILVYSGNTGIYFFDMKRRVLIKKYNAPCWLLSACYSPLTNELLFGSQCEAIHVFDLSNSRPSLNLTQYKFDENADIIISGNDSRDYLTTNNCFYNFCTNVNIQGLRGRNYLLHSETKNEDFLLVDFIDSITIYTFPTIKRIARYYIGKILQDGNANKLYMMNEKTIFLEKTITSYFKQNRSIYFINDNTKGFNLKKNWRFTYSSRNENLFYVHSPTNDSINIGRLTEKGIETVHNYYPDYKKFNYNPLKDSAYINLHGYGYDEDFSPYKFELTLNRIFVSPNGEWIVAFNFIDSAKYNLINTKDSLKSKEFYIPPPVIKTENYMNENGEEFVIETLIEDTTLFPRNINLLEFIPWNKNHVICTSSSGSAILDLNTRKRVKNFIFGFADNEMVRFNKERRTIEILVKNGSESFVIDENYNLVANYKLDTADKKLSFLNDNLYYNGYERYNVNYLFNRKNGVGFNSLQVNQEYVIVNPENYYMSSNPKLDQLIFKVGNNYYSFEQFDLKFNRPDLIIQQLSCNQEERARSFHQAYLKRLKKRTSPKTCLKKIFIYPS